MKYVLRAFKCLGNANIHLKRFFISFKRVFLKMRINPAILNFSNYFWNKPPINWNKEKKRISFFELITLEESEQCNEIKTSVLSLFTSALYLLVHDKLRSVIKMWKYQQLCLQKTNQHRFINNSEKERLGQLHCDAVLRMDKLQQPCVSSSCRSWSELIF